MKRKVVISEFPVGYTGRHPHDIYGGYSGRKLLMKKKNIKFKVDNTLENNDNS